MLDKIINNKLKEIELLKNKIDITSIDSNKKNIPFYEKILANQNIKKNSIIAEIKRRSPSKGILIENLNISDTAISYESGGATCVSVLTEKKYFDGSNSDLLITKKSITIPVLRKDFILDSIQVYESKMLGADCILLIIAALTQDAFKELYNLAISLNLDVLVEVHDIDELNFALSCNAKLIGINNRNLKTFDVDINASLDLSKHISDSDVAIVSESGITNRDDIYKLNKSGIYTFLIGEHLVKSKDIKKSLGEFVNEV
tara:strand:+ start:1977 stop:2753 length:777 start_codon:yes stop_codon:yes gene_type:complete